MYHSDPTTYALPKREEVKAETKKQALFKFAEAHDLSVTGMERNAASFYTKDGASVQYKVADSYLSWLD